MKLAFQQFHYKIMYLRKNQLKGVRDSKLKQERGAKYCSILPLNTLLCDLEAKYIESDISMWQLRQRDWTHITCDHRLIAEF